MPPKNKNLVSKQRRENSRGTTLIPIKGRPGSRRGRTGDPRLERMGRGSGDHEQQDADDRHRPVVRDERVPELDALKVVRGEREDQREDHRGRHPQAQAGEEGVRSDADHEERQHLVEVEQQHAVLDHQPGERQDKCTQRVVHRGEEQVLRGGKAHPVVREEEG